uniref:hypothetical protein n=2 Tax=Salmonella enterica TaxID=28901 RepID=UPI001C3E4043
GKNLFLVNIKKPSRVVRPDEEGFEFVYGSKFTLTDRIIEVSLARYSRQRPKKIYIQRKSVGSYVHRGQLRGLRDLPL